MRKTRCARQKTRPALPSARSRTVATAYRHFRRRRFFILGEDENIHLNLSAETSLKIFFRALAGPGAPISQAPHLHFARLRPASTGPNGAESAAPVPAFSRVK